MKASQIGNIEKKNEKRKKKKRKKKEDSLREHWDIYHTNIHIRGSQKKKRERKDPRKYSKR